MEISMKERWETPEIKVFGNIDDITNQLVKKIGPNDGLFYIVNSPDTTIGS